MRVRKIDELRREFGQGSMNREGEEGMGDKKRRREKRGNGGGQKTRRPGLNQE